MAVFRIEKTRDYTVMSNHHLRNTDLSLKAKGLLSLMLSLPEEWDYTTKGLARICKDGVDSICAGVRELEDHGYVVRERVRNANGQLGAIEYTILEQPRPPEPKREKPERENPVQANPVLGSPVLGKPEQENPDQLNIDISSNQISKKDLSITQPSNPIQSNPPTPAGARMGTDGMGAREAYREVIFENIGYEYLIEDPKMDREQLDEIAELIVDTVCSARKTIRVAGDDYPAEVVKSRFMKLDSSHVQYVMDCMKDNTTYVRNIKKYLLEAQKNKSPKIHRGKQTLKQLAGQNAGLANIEISDKNIKAFTHVAKKYHVDFALKKDTTAEQPRYLIFFKSRDADAITAAFQEFASRKMGRDEKTSVRERLAQAREQAAQKAEHRALDREKVKVKERGVEL